MTLFVEKLVPGTLFSGAHVEEVADHSPPDNTTGRYFGFRFFEQTIHKATRDDGVVFDSPGEKTNFSAWTYWGREYSLDEVRAMAVRNPSRYNILLSNLVINDYARVVRTKFGQFMPLEPEDKVIPAPVPPEE